MKGYLIKESRKSRLIIISIAVAVLLISAGVGYSFLSKSSPAKPPQVTTPVQQPAPPPQVKPPTEQPAPSFEQKIENLKKVIADVRTTGESKEVTMVFSETEANNQAAKLVAQTKIPKDIPLKIESIHIDFQSNNKVLTEAQSVIYDRFKVTIKAETQANIKKGRLDLEVTNISFGFVPLPNPLKDRIVELGRQKIDALQSQFAKDENIDLEFTNINIEGSKVTIKVIIKPGA